MTAKVTPDRHQIEAGRRPLLASLDAERHAEGSGWPGDVSIVLTAGTRRTSAQQHLQEAQTNGRSTDACVAFWLCFASP
jgi:hypothetical protein